LLPHDFVIKTYEACSLLLFDNNLSIASTLVLLSTFFRRCITIESSLSLVWCIVLSYTCCFVCCARYFLRVEEGSWFIALKMKSSKEAKDEERAVRVAFRWRKASVPNHLLPMLCLQDYICINRNMENHSGKQCNHKTYGFVLAN
jgi:hypothetical protein